MIIRIFDKYFARSIFVIATATILLAFAEGLAQLIGRSLVYQLYSPGRLLELAATLLVFVVVQLLRQIRNELKYISLNASSPDSE